MSITTKTLLEIKNLNYQVNDKLILENIDFQINEGDYLALLGPNGGGKTTLIKLILGIIENSKQFKRSIIINQNVRIGYVPQRINTGFQELIADGMELLTTGINYNKQNLNGIITQFQLEPLLTKNISTLSGGQFQKLLIARSILSGANFLILDEPTTGIDATTRTEFWKILKELNQQKKVTIIIISHDISEVTVDANRVVFLDKQIQCYHNVSEFINETNQLRNSPNHNNHKINLNHKHV